MKIIFLLFITTLLDFGWCGAATNAPAKTVSGFELEDQYETLHPVKFPKSKITVLTVADQKGSEQVNDWIRPIYQRYEKRIDIAGVADVSTVPARLRSFVRRAFKKQVDYPVMLDWGGGVSKSFGYSKNQVSVFVLSVEGTILIHVSGKVTDLKLKSLFEKIDHALSLRPAPK